MRIWEIQANGAVMAKTAVQHNGPVLSCTWSKVIAFIIILEAFCNILS